MDILVTVWILILGAMISEGCSVVPGTEIANWSMEKTLYNTPVVVYAYYESKKYYPDGTTEVNFDHANAVLRLHCIFKTDHNITGDQIEVFRVEPQISCSGTEMTPGKEYIFALSKNADNGMYDLYEGVTLGEAAYEYKDDILEKTANVCGLDDYQPPSTGCRADDSCCPRLPDLDPTKCIKGTTTDNGAHAGKSANYFLCSLLIVIAMVLL